MTDLSVGNLPDKRLVAVSFSRAAASYDSVAELQRAVGHELIGRLPPDVSPRRWLDVGSGTGYFSRVLGQQFAGSEGVALDIAQGMLTYARPLGGAQHFIAGDAECLPLQDNRCDLIFSSLALQWCEHFDGVLKEAQRVLRPGGVLAFASLCVGTLSELRDSWQAVDGQVHVNRFRSFAAYQQRCADSGFQVLSLQTQPHVLHYPQVRHLTHELKALGAHNLNPGRPEGLTGRARLQGLMAAYEHFRQPQGLPATYQVVYGILENPR
ncbi:MULTISPECIES: malonyl-ACP O-methyltransferase BioC [Pseudomonas]|uniref:malonyl-ACP O-methyltransferase BioC n=1 Tax=Pseudomonas TaxID=286 RepID=UPI0006423C0F|nr:malonyl-ACP O-methyltransferase BioC [Pseudomonas lundensis]NLU00417.1 malonyl-ACP O-methyltransferase BioC [Pseudomonas lundensis]NNA04626.1 malonyl-ACP O-methyltransferase BioC [Pseudomonas lundensis]NNA05263.1 malonyl-ACP O-methyltransferase BioC [Pseudomonas lundensis]NNA28330.1 malonyl-ACP O-methyltransferase BioC [Pseudomonas lundensis]NNA37759.1 malonyl-ACP O-methyltransferase BioC [Pseudomonas lundensis]